MRDVFEGSVYGALAAIAGVILELIIAGLMVWAVREIRGDHNCRPAPTDAGSQVAA